MANKAISVAVIGTFVGLGLTTAFAVADEPGSGATAARNGQAVRNQTQTETPEGYGLPLAVAGAEVGQQNTRQLGPGDGSGTQASRSDGAAAQGAAARNGKGHDKVDTKAKRSSQSKQANTSKASKQPAAGTTRSRSIAGQRLQLRDPSSGCSGTPTSTRSQSSGGQRRGGGGRR